jgi:protein tyrosine/serine phosphatase
MTHSFFFRWLQIAAGTALLGVVAIIAHAQTSTDAARSGNAALETGSSAQRLKLSGVPNAGKISDALLRGAQPTRNGFAELKNLGVTTIVNLRQTGDGVEWERKLAESLGLHFVNIPVSGWSAPSDAQVAQFLKLFHDAAGQRVFVHCYYGDDRTGTMVATYRIAQQHWTADQAIQEMYTFGFHYYLYPNMESYVRNFPANFAAGSAFSLLRAVPTPEAKQP